MDWYPLYNSVRIAAVSTTIVYFLGIFLANVVARAPCVAKGVLDVVLTLPLVLPPTVTSVTSCCMTPGIPEAMRAASMAITPRGCLSRAAAGIVDRTLIVNLPGSPKAARENIEAVIDALGHGLIMLRGGPADCATDATKPTARR